MRLPGVPVRIAVVAVLLALTLAGLVAREGVARAQGQEVRLAITGYDPRSPLSGHYVQFQLKDTLPAEQVCRGDNGNARSHGRLWFAIRPEGVRHRIVAMADSRPAALRKGEVAVLGEPSCIVVAFTPPGSEPRNPTTTVSLDIGLDRLHLDQTEAVALETALRGRGADAVEALVIVSVGRDGKARLKGMVVDGRRIDLDWF